jgi:cytochrome c-type biogenesis protein CcmH/NrfG
MGKFQEAIKPYEILISTDPGNAEGWERLEELYRYTNQPEKADKAKKTAEDLRKM